MDRYLKDSKYRLGSEKEYEKMREENRKLREWKELYLRYIEHHDSMEDFKSFVEMVKDSDAELLKGGG